MRVDGAAAGGLVEMTKIALEEAVRQRDLHPDTGDFFALPRCPHCRIDKPNLAVVNRFVTTDHTGSRKRYWAMYKCARCGGVVTAAAASQEGRATEIYPVAADVDAELPVRARHYLRQAMDSLHAPSGAVVLAASAIDAMLKAKNYKEGKLFARINQAAAEHLITTEMAAWAHDVRLDSNDERHADEDATLPTTEDAERVIDFAKALGQFLFVLPERVKRGRSGATPVKK